MSKTTHSHNLTEVLCGFWFNPTSNVWDSTFFGKYYEEIRDLGYSEKQEQKGVQIKLGLKNDSGKTISSSEINEVESRMVFKNTKENFATLMAPNFISFHKLTPYISWENLLENQAVPGIEKYNNIGLGKDVEQVQALYLNKYTLDINEKLSDYFNFIPSIQEFGIGIESNLVFESQYELEPNLLQQIKLNSIIDHSSNTKNVFLECSCFAFAHEQKDWQTLLEQAHSQNNIVFKKITVKC